MPKEVEELAERIEGDGGHVLAVYQEPYESQWLIFAMLPLEKVTPTPFQRDLSPPHVERLKEVISTVGLFLDPVVAIRKGEGYWTPNGNHRRAALDELQKDMNFIPAIVVPNAHIASYILALNTEKAHNLREKSLECIRMYRQLVEQHGDTDECPTETALSFQFEYAHHITLGLIYEQEGRFSGGAYVSLLRKIDDFLDERLDKAINERERRAARIKEVDKIVDGIVEQLHERGIRHPYVRQFVVAQAMPYKRKRIVEATFDEGINALMKNLQVFDVESVTPERVASAAFGVGE